MLPPALKCVLHNNIQKAALKILINMYTHIINMLYYFVIICVEYYIDINISQCVHIRATDLFIFYPGTCTDAYTQIYTYTYIYI